MIFKGNVMTLVWTEVNVCFGFVSRLSEEPPGLMTYDLLRQRLGAQTDRRWGRAGPDLAVGGKVPPLASLDQQV